MRPLLKNLEDQTIVVTGVASEMPGVHGPAGAARDQPGLALTGAQAFLDPEALGRDLDRALNHASEVGVHICGRSRDSLLR